MVLMVLGVVSFLGVQIAGVQRFPLRLDAVSGIMLVGFGLLVAGMLLRGRRPPFTEEESRDARGSAPYEPYEQRDKGR